MNRHPVRPASGVRLLGGFTLVEVLVSVAVIAFGCLAVSQMQISSMRGNLTAANITVASILAESEMERLKSLPEAAFQEEVRDGSREEGPLNRLGLLCPVGQECSGYIFTRRIRFFPGFPTTLSTQAAVEVTWADSSGGHSVAYNTALTALTF
ncbi:MAG: prepilin-type N-terminal cleavage/methylation domain-containing protein [Deltaproteobacteria bacterium]|jgi:prepilin-type N-terminal cleavage/methylation domain-containing protein|nr:prepilin-type N-terminal cleavage/methylation domain-containing protein [Deltaproteobacteria bacterium]